VKCELPSVPILTPERIEETVMREVKARPRARLPALDEAAYRRTAHALYFVAIARLRENMQGNPTPVAEALAFLRSRVEAGIEHWQQPQAGVTAHDAASRIARLQAFGRHLAFFALARTPH
jgi:hypothetical protein